MFEAGRRAALWYVNVTVIKLVRRSMIMKIFVWTRSCFTVHNYLRGPGQTLWRMELEVSRCQYPLFVSAEDWRLQTVIRWGHPGWLWWPASRDLWWSSEHLLLSPAAAAAGRAGSVYLRILMANQDISDCNPPPCACEEPWESWWWYSCFPLAALTTNAERDR